MNIKQISLIAMMAAITLSIYMIISPIYLIFFVLAVISLKSYEAYLFSIVIGFLTYILSGQIITLSNIIWLPIIVFFLKHFEGYIYGGKLSDGCLSNPSRHHHGRLAFITFIAVLIANLGSEIIAMFIQDLGIEALILSSPIWIGGAILNAIFIGFIGIQTQRRISKTFLKLR
jgi:hypothetical protein